MENKEPWEESALQSVANAFAKSVNELEQWKELAQDMYFWLDTYMHTRATIDKSHPVHDLLERYEELEKQ